MTSRQVGVVKSKLPRDQEATINVDDPSNQQVPAVDHRILKIVPCI